MGYRIEYAMGGRTMLVRVSGRSHVHMPAIAREIRNEAKRASVRRLVIDVRGLADRFGNLSTLVRGTCRNRRLAVVDDDANNLRYYPFSQLAARRRNSEMRYFSDPRDALAWIEG